MSIAIKVENVGKIFRIPHKKNSTLMGHFVSFFSKNVEFEEMKALSEINFSVGKGEIVGIMGPNGSGKTTLLRIMAGITNPSAGSVTIKGAMAPLLQLGLGFESELTARENIYLSGAIMGLSKKEIAKKFGGIVEFAGIGRFIDLPLKNYSAGMYSRLAFAMALQAEGDIYLIDEIFSVGDNEFQQKCIRLFNRMKKENKTVVFVSHDANAIKKVCDRVVVLTEGKITFEGNAKKAIDFYEGMKEKDPEIKKMEEELLKNRNSVASLSLEIDSLKKEKEAAIKDYEKKVSGLQNDINERADFIKKLLDEMNILTGGEKGRHGSNEAAIENVEITD